MSGEAHAFVVCGIDGCEFAVERGEGRTMALHKSEDHPAAPSTPEPSGHCRGCEADADLARRAHLDSPEPSDPDTAVTDAYKLGFHAGQRAAPSTEPALDALVAAAPVCWDWNHPDTGQHKHVTVRFAESR